MKRIYIALALVALVGAHVSMTHAQEATQGTLNPFRLYGGANNVIAPRVITNTLVVGSSTTSTASIFQVAGNMTITGLAGNGTVCVQANNSGTLSVAAGACSSGGLVVFKANGGAFVSTTTINFQQGTNITITTSTDGTYTITGSAGGAGSVSTSSAITVDNFPFWATVGGGLSGTSTLSHSGTSLLQNGAFNATGTITQNGIAVLIDAKGLSPISVSTSSGIVTIQVATSSASQNGILTSADWTTFNSKQAAITAFAPLYFSGANLFVNTSTNATSGILTAADWTTFSNKASSSIPFVTIGNTADASAERALTGGVSVTVTDGGANTTVTIDTRQALNTTSSPTFVSSTWTGLTAGSVLFSGTGGALAQSNANFFWDATNNRLGIGTSSPLFALSVAGTSPQSTTSSLVLWGSQAITGGNASGTYMGLNATTTYNGDLINFQVGGVAKFRVASSGLVTFGVPVPVTSGGTGLSSVSQGDIFYGSASNVITALAKDTNATRYLANTGASNNPAWAQVALGTGVSGILPIANGGVNTSTAPAKAALLVGDGTTYQFTTLPDCAAGNYMTYNTSTRAWACAADANSGTESGWRSNNPFVYLATSTYQVGIGATSTGAVLFVQSTQNGTTTVQIQAKAGQTADLLQVTSSSGSGTKYFSVASSGQTIVKTEVNMQNAFQVQTFDGTSTVSVDTRSGRDYIISVTTSSATSTLTTANTYFAIASSGIPLFLGTSTISLGGSSLTGGTCTSTVTLIPLVMSTSTDGFDTYPQTFPGADALWLTYISRAGTTSTDATTEVCEPVTATPTATKYNIFPKRMTGL